MKEVWKDIPEHEGRYQVSDLGRVKSLSRWVENNHSGYFTKEKLLKIGINHRGYHYVNIKDNLCKKRKVYIHVAVMKCFVGEKKKGYEIHHKDENQSNNTLSNLVYLTEEEHERAHYTEDSFIYYDKSKNRYFVRFHENNRTHSRYTKTKDEAKKIFNHVVANGIDSIKDFDKKPEYISYVKCRKRFLLKIPNTITKDFKTKEEAKILRKELIGY